MSADASDEIEMSGANDERKLIVGLGNPGRKYDNTRHNVGFEVIASLARRFSCERPKARFSGEAVEARIDGARTILLYPLTYMNRSGRSVREACDFYKLPASSVLVICDDMNLPLGRLRFRPKGSAGGQKGLKDIIHQLGTEEIQRLRVGVGTPPPNWKASDFVLSRFHGDELDIIRDACDRAVDGVRCWLTDGISEAMNRFNAESTGKSKTSVSKTRKSKTSKSKTSKSKTGQSTNDDPANGESE